jgi:5-methyltetrahydropteroyltriglutamate--homocysteine methyltransferase
LPTSVRCGLLGIHSRSESLVKTTRDYDRGRVDESALKAAFEKDTRELVELQKSSGFDILSDGQLQWQDFLRPISEIVSGLEIGADLSRWFDTNTFYRKPTVTKQLSANTSLLEKKYFSDVHLASGPRGIAVPGPYTLGSLVEDLFYGSKEELIHEFAKVLKEILERLSQLSYEEIQVNEPSLVYRYGDSCLNNPKNLQTFVTAYQDELSHLKSKITLHTHFGNCSGILKDLLNLEAVNTIGVDFTQTSIESLSSVTLDGKGLGVGCVDARSSFVESPEWISEFCIHALKKLVPSGILILPSCDLKYLPRTYADQKLIAMGAARKIVGKRIAE